MDSNNVLGKITFASAPRADVLRRMYPKCGGVVLSRTNADKACSFLRRIAVLDCIGSGFCTGSPMSGTLSTNVVVLVHRTSHTHFFTPYTNGCMAWWNSTTL